jgi:type IV secretory pathway VirB2 component (pilin)
VTLAASPLLEPNGAQPLVDAVRWVEQALLGTTATVIATMAVAAIGVLMLGGQIPVGRAVTAILGCFVLFGAVTIAAGIMGLRDGLVADRMVSLPVTPAPPAVAPTPPAQPQVYDPYAGASVPHP